MKQTKEDEKIQNLIEHLTSFRSLERIEKLFLKAIERVIEEAKKQNYLLDAKFELKFFDNQKFTEELEKLINQQTQTKMRN
jgi:hypothetical protein